MSHDGFDPPHAFTAAVMAQVIVVISIFIGAAVIVNFSSIFGAIQ